MVEIYSVIGLLVGLFFIGVTLLKLKNQTISQSTFVIWILIGIGVIAISTIPLVMNAITAIVGTDFSVSAILGTSTLLLLLLVFYLHEKIDFVNQRITKLVSEMAANRFYQESKKKDPNSDDDS